MKLTILLNFGYHRKGWIAPIEALGDTIEIVYLYFISKQQEQLRHTHHRVIYWSDYKNVNDLLDAVKPDKLVSMSMDSGLGILLNYATRKRGIRTYILQHGIYSNYQDYREREARMKQLGFKDSETEVTPMAGYSTLSFYRASLKSSDYIHFIKFPLYYILQKLEGFRFACRWVRFEARMPSYYICYTPQNAIIHRQLDNPPDHKFLYIGNPEMDEFLTNNHSAKPEYVYYLLIDQPLADNRYQEHVVTRQQMIDHYTRLNEFCLQKSARLVVKLHPESYHSNWLPVHENILWLKDYNNLPGLLLQAEGCFGYFSSLVTPAIVFNRVVLFQVSNNELQQDAKSLGLVQLLDFFSYQVNQIDFDRIRKDDLNIFAGKYLYFNDGNSIDRLKRILLS